MLRANCLLHSMCLPKMISPCCWTSVLEHFLESSHHLSQHFSYLEKYTQHRFADLSVTQHLLLLP